MVLTTVGLVIAEGICDARYNTHRKGLYEMNHGEVDESLLP